MMTRNATAVGAGSVGVLVGLILVAPELVAPISNLFARLVDLIFRTEGEIARSNMQRQPSRAATTAAAVMISLAIIIALLGVMSSLIGGFLTYVDKSVAGADFVVIPTNLILAAATPARATSSWPTCAAPPGSTPPPRCARRKGGWTTIRRSSSGSIRSSIRRVATFEFSGDGQTPTSRSSGRARAYCQRRLRRAERADRGQKVSVTTVNGDKTYEVVAVGSDYLNAKLATVYISQERMKEDFGTENNAAVMLSMMPGADPVRVEHDLAGTSRRTRSSRCTTRCRSSRRRSRRSTTRWSASTG